MIAILVLALLLAGAAGAAGKSAKAPLKIGHRGTRALLDENTLESMKKAAELGVDMLEFDVQRTQDNVFVIMHDETVDRTSNGHGRIDQMTAAEFKALKTKSGFHPPSLDEVLDWLSTNNLGFILDFKIPDPKAAEDLLAVIEKRGLLPRAVFESPIPQIAGRVEKLKPEAVTATYPTNQICMVMLADRNHIDQVSYNWHFATPGQVLLAHHRGHQVLVWTVDSRGLIRWFTLLKVDGIMTDDPNLFQPKKK
jgi:glycerophosphoryl diester phosphodiesterase